MTKTDLKNFAVEFSILLAPMLLFLLLTWSLTGAETWLATLGSTPHASQAISRFGYAIPYAASALAGALILPIFARTSILRHVAVGVMVGEFAVVAFAAIAEFVRLSPHLARYPFSTVIRYVDPYTVGGATLALLTAVFALKVAIAGNRVFAAAEPKRITGRRAIHGDAAWMTMPEAAKLFPETAGIVVGERYRVDQEHLPTNFDPRAVNTWGPGGDRPLICFDAGFGSTHGIVFAGSGGFKTTSTVIPTALRFAGTLIVLDPSTEIAAMVAKHRTDAKQKVIILDPKQPKTGFNVLDWIGQHGASPEEDIASVAAWLMSEKPRVTTGSDDFFRTLAEQLITAVIANVVLSEPNDTTRERSLREVRRQLALPEKTLQEKLGAIYEKSSSRFAREAVAPFINMTPQTFSGVYANAAKETHWLSYDNYAAMVSGNSFSADGITDGKTTVFLNIDLSTLENHPGLARVIVGAFLKAIYNRNGEITGRALFLLDEVARLGYMRIIETARDAGRKYGITLLMVFQSLGQIREAFGGRDATSKWFESASWVSFAAINDPETARYISDRCGLTTVELNQVSRTSRSAGASRTRSDQLSQRPLIMPDEVMRMRSDEQIVFTSGNPPLRCGRAIYFRRPDMLANTQTSSFTPGQSNSQHTPDDAAPTARGTAE